MRRITPRDIALYALLFAIVFYAVSFLQRADWEDGPDYSQIRTYFTQERVEYFTLKDNVLTLTLRDENGSDKTSTFTYELARTDFFYNDMHQLIDQQLSDGILKGYDYPPGIENAWWYSLVGPVLMVAAAGVFLFVIFRQRAAASGGPPGANHFGHARTRTLSDQSKPVTFDDVAGAEEEKGELQEIVEFLRDPERFTALGARIPKGVLLVGPPGTGKTLIAKAVAGEAGVHFLSISGSDFVELYVGVGASRVRDLFEQAKKEAPAIVFIDEIDAVGRRRGAGLGGGHDEREQTLNQLLVEMDGFGSNEGVIVLAATNRQDILDPALLRPGRFDRQIYVGLPDIRGREAILKVHAKRKPLAEDVSLAQIAQATAGFTGADLANLLNEAALLAARQHSQFITAAHLHEAMLKVIAGPEKKSRVVIERERKLTAYHEAGHAIVIHDLPTQDPVHEITIIPRGMAGGMTISLPEGMDNDLILSGDDRVAADDYKQSIRDKVVVIKPEAISPEYYAATSQLWLCTGGFGSSASPRGRTCFCINLHDTGRQESFYRSDIMGTMDPEHLPNWAKVGLGSIQQAEKLAGKPSLSSQIQTAEKRTEQQPDKATLTPEKGR